MMNLFKGSLTFVLAVVLLCHTQSTSAGLAHRSVQNHQHHRRGPSVRLEYEPLHGHNAVLENTDDIYFPVDTESLNLTCTVTNPSHKYRMKLLRSSRNGSDVIPLISIDDTYIVNPALLKKSQRYNVVPNDDDNGYLKVTFVTSNLRLSDNGIYKCLYHNQSRQMNLVVYKPLTPKDVRLIVNDGTSDIVHDDKSVELTLGHEYKFVCKVNELYPKPIVKYLLNSNDSINNLVTEDTMTVKSNDGFDLQAVTSILKFTASYKDNDNDLACSVTANTPSADNVPKTLRLQVNGVEFVDEECPEEVMVKLGQSNTVISCLFYANPNPTAEWKNQIIAEQGIDESDASSDGATTAVDDEFKKAESYGTIQTDDKFSVSQEDVRPGLHRATLTIIEPLTDKDIKKYIIEIGAKNQVKTRTIRLQTEFTRSAQVVDTNGSERPLNKSFNFKIVLIGSLFNYIIYKLICL